MMGNCRLEKKKKKSTVRRMCVCVARGVGGGGRGRRRERGRGGRGECQTTKVENTVNIVMKSKGDKNGLALVIMSVSGG